MDKETKDIKLDRIRIDGGTQFRELDMDHVAELRRAEEIQPGVLPKVIVYFDGKDHWLADGFHRYHVYLELDRKTISSEVREGTKRHAVLHACGSNARHGKPRTNTEKRGVVEFMLKDKEWGLKSVNWIAQQCVVSHALVTEVQKEIAAETGVPRSTAVETKDGRKMETAKIGSAMKEKAEAKKVDPLPAREVKAAEPSAKPVPMVESPTLPRGTETFDGMLNLLTNLTKSVHLVAGDGVDMDPLPGGFWLAQNLQKVEADLRNLRNTIRFCRPYQVCPHCQGKQCSACKGQGWVTEQIWEAAPKDLKARAEA